MDYVFVVLLEKLIFSLCTKNKFFWLKVCQWNICKVFLFVIFRSTFCRTCETVSSFSTSTKRPRKWEWTWPSTIGLKTEWVSWNAICSVSGIHSASITRLQEFMRPPTRLLPMPTNPLPRACGIGHSSDFRSSSGLASRSPAAKNRDDYIMSLSFIISRAHAIYSFCEEQKKSAKQQNNEHATFSFLRVI